MAEERDRFRWTGATGARGARRGMPEAERLETLGRHLIAEFYDCDRVLLDDVERMRALLRRAAEIVGATIVGDTFHSFSPQGVSGTVVIAESHLSVHTWPESGYVAVDIFTCGGLDPQPGFVYLGQRLAAGSARVQEIVRGLPSDVAKGRPLAPGDVTIMAHQETLPLSPSSV